MTAARPVNGWTTAEVRAPTALGLGAAPPRLAQAPVAIPPPAEHGDPRAVRLPVAASDQEGIYQGLQWALRALDECGRAFTRVTSRVNKIESRLGAVEGAIADVGARLRRLEQRAAAPPPVSASASQPPPVAPLRLESQMIGVRKDLAAVFTRLAKLEAAPPSPTPSPPPASPPPEPPSRVVALTARVGALEADIQGVYRELDKVAELVSERFEALAVRLDGIGDGIGDATGTGLRPPPT